MFNRLRAVLCLAVAACAAGCGNANSFAGSAPPTAGAPQLALSTASLAFPATSVGTTSAGQVVTFSNTGSANLALTAVTLSDPSDYSLMSTCPGTLAANAACTLSVAFKPQTASSLPATITLSDNATTPTQTITLSGTGTALPQPQAALSATSVTFPVTSAGVAAAAAGVVVTNSGNAPLTIGAITLSGSGAAVFSQSNACPASLAAGSACTISLGFTPTAAATTYSATLNLSDNSGGIASSIQTVALSGTSATAAPVATASLSAASLTFPGTAVGSPAAVQTVTLSNSGNAPLTAISIGIGGGLTPASFAQTGTCGQTLAAAASCTLSVTFTPQAQGNNTALLTVADSAANSPQTVALAGTGLAATATLSATSIAFPGTSAGTSSAASSVTLTNSGNAALTLSSITLGGANAAAFTFTTTCGATLAPATSCTLSATFTPPAGAAYSAAIALVDSAANSPQTIALSGSGTTGAITHTLYTFPENDGSVSPLYALVNAAQKTLDMTMYELVDTTFSADLVAACNRGVKVRVILDQNLEKSSNTPAYNQLNAVANCSAAWANPAFQATHQKSFIIDGTQVAIMSLNLTSRYYSSTRDFALIENDPADIAAIQATFNADFNSTTDFNYQPTAGDDLIWSPTTATADLLAIINNAGKTLLVENEEMSAANIVSALEAACKRGVAVKIAMTDTGSYHANFSALEAAGCGVHTYADNASTLYIHAKAMVADYGLPAQAIYMGSINFSTASMTENRELGLYLTDAASAQALNNIITADYAGAPPF